VISLGSPGVFVGEREGISERLEGLADEVGDANRALVLTAGYLGLRWGELAGLKRSRLNPIKGTLEVAETLVELNGRLEFSDGKTKAARRVISMPPFLLGEIDRHLSEHAKHPVVVFCGPDGGLLRRQNFLRRVWAPAVKRAGLAPLRFHDLRHTAAGIMIEQGEHPKVISNRLGHASIQITMDVYGHLLPDLDEAVSDRLEVARSKAVSSKSAAHLLHVGGRQASPGMIGRQD
jgi:integrase